MKTRKEVSMKILLAVLLLLSVAASSHAAVKVEELTYKQGETDLHGYLYYDDAMDSERPGVLVVHEWWGLNDYAKERARMLAEMGYVALALDMYGEGKTTEHPQTAGEWAGAVTDELGRERFRAAYELLKNHKLTADGKIAAIGYCFGGGVVLRAAKAGVDLRGVVSFHGSLPAESVEPGTIKAKILACHGADDPFVSADQVQKFQQSLRDAGADWQFISYGGAKHSFTSKQADARGIPALQYNAAADQRSWAAMRLFFDEILVD
jgi:dienelactone hydrolase